MRIFVALIAVFLANMAIADLQFPQLAFSDRLRAIECPTDMIDQIGGWRLASSIGTNYGHGYSRLQVGRWLRLVLIPLGIR